ncbi:MAG: HAD family phosphatase [Saprospiraceae bacterium]|jgi:2-haloacid dehalogenase|nr:HAD family phosphatase [Saprospiraceae bacterium]
MIDTIIFDLGNVLIRWDPGVVYKDYFKTEDELNYFFEHVCTLEWNEEQDKGRPIETATELLVKEHPSHEEAIRMYYGRWKEMILGPVDGTPEILNSLHQKQNQRLLALTNWSAELFPYALENFDFLGFFEGILVSGEEKMKKPDLEIYRRFEEKFPIDRTKSVFIDDSAKNIAGAKEAGWNVIHFKNASQLETELNNLGITV